MFCACDRFVRVALMFVLLLPLAATVVQAQGRPGEERYMVEFRRLGPDAATSVRAAGGSLVHEFPEHNVIAAWIPAGAVEGLRRNPNVVRIEGDARRFPLAQTVPYGIPMVQADTLQEGIDSALSKVCIIDSGYWQSHEDLSRNVSGSNDSGTGSWDEDGCGHGTHVAGTIAALDNTFGVVGVLGGGQVPLHIVKVFNDSCAWTYSSDLINALNACRTAGANVVNMSLGGGRSLGPWERRAFDDAYKAGVLSIAAAGNEGSTRYLYPASYDSVIGVGAIDEDMVIADFSQRNDQVELVAPGVRVLSTVPAVETNTLTVADSVHEGYWIENAARSLGVTGPLANGGRCTSTSGSWSGRVVLCERGDITFFDKVSNVQNSGGVAAVIYNNTTGDFLGTLGNGNSSTIPAISLSQENGQFLVTNGLGVNGTVVSWQEKTSGYESWSGTSMATPHVAGVAALIWSQNRGWTNQQIRNAMQATAEDLGPTGKDNTYGYGLVQAQKALCVLDPLQPACGGPVNQTPTASFTYSCSDAACQFTDTSTDPDDTIAQWHWTFGDGNSSTLRHPSHVYADGGRYVVSLQVWDNGGLNATASQEISIAEQGPPGGEITLSGSGYKVRGLNHADLAWSGATGPTVDIYRNGGKIATVSNGGGYTDALNTRGGGDVVYQVCEGDTSTCSNQVTVTF